MAAHNSEAEGLMIERGGSPWIPRERNGQTPAADYIGISSRNLDSYVKQGLIRVHKLGRRSVFHRDDLDEFVRVNAVGSEA